MASMLGPIVPSSPPREEPLQQAKCSVRLATTLLHGVPVVASAVGEQANYGAEGAARLVPAQTSPEAFADEVCSLLLSDRDQELLSLRARRRLLTEYAWPRLGRDLCRFYRQLLAAGSTQDD